MDSRYYLNLINRSFKKTENAAAAALWTAADAAAAAAECDDPRTRIHPPQGAPGRRRHRQCTSTNKCTCPSAGTPTRRKATPDSEGGSQNPAPPKPEAHRHTSAKGHCRQPHNQAVSGSPT